MPANPRSKWVTFELFWPQSPSFQRPNSEAANGHSPRPWWIGLSLKSRTFKRVKLAPEQTWLEATALKKVKPKVNVVPSFEFEKFFSLWDAMGLKRRGKDFSLSLSPSSSPSSKERMSSTSSYFARKKLPEEAERRSEAPLKLPLKIFWQEREGIRLPTPSIHPSISLFPSC